MRTLLRHRSELIQAATQHVQHMHKSLTQMNLQIHHVLSDITGISGMAIIDAIVAGQRDPGQLATLCHAKVHSDRQTVIKSLTGNYRTEHLFTLKQSREFFGPISNESSNVISKLNSGYLNSSHVNPAETPWPPDQKRNRAGKNEEGRTAIRIRDSICVRKPISCSSGRRRCPV